MYGHFIQFTIPKIGQVLVAVVLYLNFLKLPFVACFVGAHPAVYLLLPLLLLAVMSWIGRDPLGPGMIVNSHLTGLYIAGDIVGLLARAIGGTVQAAWQTIWMGGLLAWVGTAAMMVWSYFKAMRLVTTTYRLQTTKPLPDGKLRVLQISDLHPGKGAMDRKRIPELNRRIRELNPDMILFTGDIFDEHVERPDFDSFNAFFATLDPPGGKWFVLGNHDLFHHWREPSYGRADLEGAFARAHIRILEDVSQLAYVGKNATPVRIVGRKDWLYTQGNRFTPAQLMPNGPDNVYTILLDHEPRELKADAAAGANLILSGHTHGGQIWPTGLVAKLFRYNELNYGMKQITPACAAIVSGGTGTWGYKIRTEGKTELVMVEIEQKNACLGYIKQIIQTVYHCARREPPPGGPVCCAGSAKIGSHGFAPAWPGFSGGWVLFDAKWPQNRQNSRLQPKVSPQLVAATGCFRYNKASKTQGAEPSGRVLPGGAPPTASC